MRTMLRCKSCLKTIETKGDEHGFDAHKIPVLRVYLKVKDEPEDVLEKIMGTGTCDAC